MHCNGKCYLSKKLKAQEKQDQQEPVSKNERFDVMPYFVPNQFALQAITPFVKPHFFIKNDNLVFSFSRSVFHPPSA